MREGRQRKRMIKLARRVSVEEIRAFLLNNDHTPAYFLLRSNGYELLRGWHPTHGITELVMDDEVAYEACVLYLKDRGIVFESEDDALAWRVQSGRPSLDLES